MFINGKYEKIVYRFQFVMWNMHLFLDIVSSKKHRMIKISDLLDCQRVYGKAESAIFKDILQFLALQTFILFFMYIRFFLSYSSFAIFCPP